MQIGPQSATVVSADANGYAVLDSVADFQVGANFYLSKTGQASVYCVVTELNRATKTIGVRIVSNTPNYGRSDISAYGSGTADLPKQEWTNPNGPTLGDTTINGDLTVNGTTVAYDLIYPAQYAVADLPDATTSVGAIAYDTDNNQFKYSNGTAWTGGAGGGGGVDTLGAFGSSPNNVGGTITGTSLSFQPADATHPGMVSTGTQSFAGNKTFTGTITASNLSGTNTGNQTITLTGDVTGSGTGSFAATIANNAVTLAKMATMATASFLGRTTASTGNVEVLTATQATALLNAMVGDSGSGGTKGLVPAPTTGDATKYLKGDGTWGSPPGTGVTTMAAIGSSPNANGATISSTTLNLQPASASYGGVITTGTQTLTGKKIFDTQVSAVALAQTTTADITIAVTTTGSDAYNIARDPLSGGDYSATPYLTLAAAIAALPKVLRHNVYINMGVGSFAGANISGFIGGGLDADGNNIGIYITGSTAAITPATGVATGTAGSGTSTTNVVKPTAAANWTASDLVGRFFYVTGGGGYISATSPILRPIKANTTTNLTVDAIAGMDDTTTFQLVDVQTTINEINSGDLVGLRIAYNSAPIIVRKLTFYGATAPHVLDYNIYSSGNNAVTLDALHPNGACNQRNFYSLKDSDLSLTNTVFSNGSNFKAEDTAKYVNVANVWMNASGPIYILGGLNGKVTKLNSTLAPSAVLQAINMNYLQAEVTANNGLATPIYFESIASMENIGGGLQGTGNTGSGTYGIQIEKAGRFTLDGSSITGSAGDIKWFGHSALWSDMSSPSYGMIESFAGNAVGSAGIGGSPKAISYGNRLFDGSVDFSSRVLLYGYLNQASNLGVPTLTAGMEYNMANGYIYTASSITGYQTGTASAATTTSITKPAGGTNWVASAIPSTGSAYVTRWVRITGGTGVGFERQISANTTTTISWVTPIPALDNTSQFEILDRTVSSGSTWVCRSIADVICNDASASIILPDNAQIAGCLSGVINHGSAAVTVKPPTREQDNVVYFGTLNGGASLTLASGSGKQYGSLNSTIGLDWWTLS